MTHTSTAQPVAYLWQHTITGQTKALMRDDVFTAGPHWRLVGPLRLATESGPGVHMATASVPVAATHWRKAQALPELTAHHPPVVNDSLTTESTVNRKVTVQVPPFTHTAKRKLDDLLAQGFRITGYAIERADVADWAPQRGFVTHGGLVGWVPSADEEVAKERTARQAAQAEVVDLKERITHAGVEQRRAVREAVLQEREACAKACEGMEANRDWVPGSLWGNIRGEMAAAIRARQ